MAEIYVQRRGGILLPVSAPDEQAIKLLPERRILTADIDANAPLRLKRWYFAMVSLLVEATGRWPDKETADKELMILAGMFESVVIHGDGTTRFTPQSKSQWGFLQWRAYLDRLIPIIVERFVGETPAKFRNRVDAFLGIKLKEAWEDR